ncbi:GrpB family protein [Pseudoalteromonas luteoviolacea]|uniref:GrpB family protein n=1 Tax=Pseudoalteromonas luteoviolacea TaxID=43657 RepID=UPI00114D533C|nr:GrpB family protein [Pseudoalteromonas luteoviolacea]TQF68041.1 GrpB family protein [Pseudoalteromonas luteoviolacea]
MSEIVICAHQSSWAKEFEQIQKQLKYVLGTHALQIDHIGSTAVADLAAKDIIDIQVSVKDLDNLEVIERLVDADYIYRDDVKWDNLVGYVAEDEHLRKHYFREPTGSRVTHIHIREVGRVNQIYPLLFRDLLRENKHIRMAYGKIKTELAHRFKDDVEAYYAIKDPYMDTLFHAATLLQKAQR